MKKWWNNFKEDLMFNITMTIISAMLLILMVKNLKMENGNIH